MSFRKSKLTRIGVFYDGNYFFHVSNYYQYQHERKARISIDGLHEFIRHQVADAEGEDVKYCQIVDAHYFRGRPRAQEAEARGLLLRERQFDDILMREGVITHYLPLGPDGEKGIDVWLALETYELAIYKRFDVIVLIACDGDFLPLVRKLNALGARVMLLGWGFSYIDQSGKDRETRTAQVLLEEVTYPVLMHQIIDDRSRKGDQRIDQLFVPHKEPGPYQKPMEMKRFHSHPPANPPNNSLVPVNVAAPTCRLTDNNNGVAEQNGETPPDGINPTSDIIVPDELASLPNDNAPTEDTISPDGAKPFGTINQTDGATQADGTALTDGTAQADGTTKSDDANQPDGAALLEAMPSLDSISLSNGMNSILVLLGKIQALREGFGFITPNDGSGNLFFFHASVLNADFNELRVGDEVAYKIGNNDKGPCAVDVEIVV